METFNKHQLAMAKERAIEKLNLGESLDLTCSLENLSLYTLTTLPMEILFHIFELCDLKDLLRLAKVCQHFRNIISEILQQRYRNFIYNYLTFKFSQNLEDADISDICLLCGPKVEKLRFSTYFNMDLLKHIEWKMGCNPMENLKFFINDNFKRNLQYFPMLQELEVQGKFLQDQTILELAKSCRGLKTIRLLDGDNRFLWGEHLADLESIENLELKCCRNLDPNHLLVLTQKRAVKSLNIMECEHMKDIPKMINLCKYLTQLHTLRLTAFTQDQTLLKAILELPRLKCLQFFWINFMPLSFEENFFLELAHNSEKSSQLSALKFENDRYYIEDESLQQWTPEKYAIMRENVCINGQAWLWTEEVFNKISQNMENFPNLQQLNFHYCRLLNYEQLEILPTLLKNLKEILICGCPRREDLQFHQQWQENMKCQLKFESFLSLKEAISLQDDASARQFSSYYRREPVMRSIECRF
uniref:F-box domain-containing protein n=2 Tax=Stomoxys calcitrans TaxID=35570 RepID=A0A1I8Q6P4_STOCA